MKNVYIVLTHTGTILSKIVKTYTGNKFSHASISLDVDLNKLYSFGRLNAYNPFIGGFVHERLDSGTFKRFKNTVSSIYALEVEDNQYIKMEKTIEYISKYSSKYKFNIIGIIAAAVNKKIPRKEAFYCSEFVKYILEMGEVETDLPDVMKPEDFKNLKGITKIYEGLLRDYNSNKLKNVENKSNEVYKKAVV